MKKVVVVGGSGFVGTKLSQALLDRNYLVHIVDIIEPRIKHERVSFTKSNVVQSIPKESLHDAFAVIHLAGQPIFGKWNTVFMKGIRDSRIRSTHNLVATISELLHKPKVLVCASAVGYYGDSGSQLLQEYDEHGSDFLARVCVDWESTARQAESYGVRVVTLRTAHVLGAGGVLSQMEKPFTFFVGGWFGTGLQWFPWVHIDDLVSMYIFAIENEQMSGPYNTAARELVTLRMFSETLGKVLGRKAWLPVPLFLVQLVLGKFAQVFSVSQKVSSEKLSNEGFVWRYGKLEEALKDIYVNK